MSKLIIDCDTGIDDALAIAYAVGNHDVELLGVTVSYGMAPIDLTYRNTRTVLDLLDCPDISVHLGSSQPSLRERVYSGKFHGDDGLGNRLDVVSELSGERAPEASAWTFIAQQVDRYPDEITLVTTGPLTNLAVLVKEYPKTVAGLKKIVVMGGALTTEGNVSKVAEANVYIDPEAANEVFQSGISLTVVPLDVTRRTLLTRQEVAKWEKGENGVGHFFASVLDFYLTAYETYHPYLAGCALHDPLAVAIGCHPEYIEQELALAVKVDLTDEFLGRIVEDTTRLGDEPSVKVVVSVVTETFETDFFEVMEKVLVGE